MSLKVDKVRFYDSLLHVRGSLRNLAKDFCSGLLSKGHFPHLFNTVENYNYRGPIPDRKYFDLSFMVGNDKDLLEFNLWYDGFDGIWDFMHQLETYCVNDVAVLAKIVEGYHDAAVANTGMSPWFNATSPSFVHEAILVQKIRELELPDDREERGQMIADLAATKFWAVLKPNEYWFAKEALRGGRTEVRKLYYAVSPEEYERGVRIRYQDICSQYPYQQVEHDFPTGTPVIHVFDKAYAPCYIHQNNPKGRCNCPNPGGEDWCDIVIERGQISADQILADEKFFGIVCVTLEPPKDLFHPVIVSWNPDAMKCIASLRPEEHVEIITTSIELVTALKNGYKLLEIHRYDEYTKTPSLWRQEILTFFIEKLVNSSDRPDPTKLEKIVKAYDAKFGCGDDIRKRYDNKEWGKNPAKKQTAKIMMNSCWGKHCQRAVMSKTLVYGKGDGDKVNDLFDNFSAGTMTLQSATPLHAGRVMYQALETQDTNADLHGGYIPAGLFVPAYGRLQLWEQLNKLGQRVLMNDTDSIVYLYDPDLYNIPEGSLLGEWEVEDIDKQHGGIHKFVGLGPKSYAIKCFDGTTLVKAKGLSIKRASSSLVNFDSMEKLVLDYLKDKTCESVQVPQMSFSWSIKQGMQTRYTLKDLQFNPQHLKGELRGATLYPFGHL